MKNIIKSPLAWIVLAGFFIRCVYVVFLSHLFAQSYFGEKSIYIPNGDFNLWLTAFKNLMATGSFTTDASNPLGYVGRMPGYSAFIGFFYLLVGAKYFTHVILWAQVLIDVFAIVLCYRIGFLLFKKRMAGYITAILYATYPMAIIWSCTLFSEGLGVFFNLLVLYLFLNKGIRNRWIWIGAAIGVGILIRPQVFIIIPFIGIGLLWEDRTNFRTMAAHIIQLTVALVITYGWWPVRNYLVLDQVVLFQDVRGINYFKDDFVAYERYIYSIQNTWEPAFDQVVENSPVTAINTQAAYKVPGDSAKLAEGIALIRSCGTSFRVWKNFYLRNQPIASPCDAQIAEIFDQLRANQVKYNANHYWITVPLQNLKKCFFKSDITHKSSGFSAKIMPLMWYYRSLFILMGLIAGICLFFKSAALRIPMFVITGYFCVWYVYMCFGTGFHSRNIEIRYMLPNDILLLIPASYVVYMLLSRLSNKVKEAV